MKRYLLCSRNPETKPGVTFRPSPLDTFMAIDLDEDGTGIVSIKIQDEVRETQAKKIEFDERLVTIYWTGGLIQQERGYLTDLDPAADLNDVLPESYAVLKADYYPVAPAALTPR